MSGNACRYAACLMAAFLLLGCDGAECQRCGESGLVRAVRDDAIHIYHNTFSFQFAPPWFNADQRSLLTSYVVFPEEAKLIEWVKWVNQSKKSCSGGKDASVPGSICPEQEFYKKAMAPFLEGLSRCATEKPVKLLAIGFASSTTVKKMDDTVEEQYNQHIDAIGKGQGICRGKMKVEEAGNPDKMFNLLIANQRAKNVAAMLNGFLSRKQKERFDIQSVPWCSHASMEAERSFQDQGDGAKGLINRRVEVLLASLPGCVNVDPDNRIDVTQPLAIQRPGTTNLDANALRSLIS